MKPPPCTQKATGSFSAPGGAHTLRKRQSSPIGSCAPIRFCMQTAPSDVASVTPPAGGRGAGCGGRKRFAPAALAA